MDEFMDLQQVKLLTRKKPIQAVPTRWNSSFYMLEYILENKAAIQAFIPTKPTLAKFNDEEWKIIDGLIKILDSLEKVNIVLF